MSAARVLHGDQLHERFRGLKSRVDHHHGLLLLKSGTCTLFRVFAGFSRSGFNLDHSPPPELNFLMVGLSHPALLPELGDVEGGQVAGRLAVVTEF